MKIANQIVVGGQYNASLRVERDYSSGNTAPYPKWYGKYIPIQIMEEYPRFYVCKVLPHMTETSYDDTLPYTVTIDKIDLEMGVFKIYER